MTNKISNLFICQRLKTINQSASEREEFLEVSKKYLGNSKNIYHAKIFKLPVAARAGGGGRGAGRQTAVRQETFCVSAVAGVGQVMRKYKLCALFLCR